MALRKGLREIFLQLSTPNFVSISQLMKIKCIKTRPGTIGIQRYYILNDDVT